jgi:hypothetical protein
MPGYAIPAANRNNTHRHRAPKQALAYFAHSAVTTYRHHHIETLAGCFYGKCSCVLWALRQKDLGSIALFGYPIGDLIG